MILTLLKPAPNVVHMYGLCTNAWDGRLRLVLELCEHGNVREYVKATALLSSTRCTAVCHDTVLEANIFPVSLDSAH